MVKTDRLVIRGIKDGTIYDPTDVPGALTLRSVLQLSLNIRYTITNIDGITHVEEIDSRPKDGNGKLMNGIWTYEAVEMLLGQTATDSSGELTLAVVAGVCVPELTFEGTADYVVKNGVRSNGPFKIVVPRFRVTGHDINLADQDYFVGDFSIAAWPDSSAHVLKIVGDA